MKIDRLDLTKITRNADKFRTSVSVEVDLTSVPWIDAGETSLLDNGSRLNTWTFKSYLSEATDAEHDSAYAFSFDLIGVRFEMITSGRAFFSAYIKPIWDEHDLNSFRVPTPSRDPFHGAGKCKQCKPSHPITEYLPPALAFEEVGKFAGRLVKIVMGPKGG